jgi:hypothetical protein
MSGKYLVRAAALLLTLFLAACGGDDSAPLAPIADDNSSTDTDPDDSGSDTTPGDSDDTDTQSTPLLGAYDPDTGAFTEGQLFETTPTNIDVGTEVPFKIALIDPDTGDLLYRSGLEVTYASPCLDANTASISGDSATKADSGVLSGVYASSGCYGKDHIVAFIGESVTPAASGTVTINPPEALQLGLVNYNPQDGTYTYDQSIYSTAATLGNGGQARLTVGIVNLANSTLSGDSSDLQKGTKYIVNFESTCASGLNTSQFDPASVTTTTGIAETIYTAGSCNETSDVITAEITDEDGQPLARAETEIKIIEGKAFQLVAGLPEPMSIAPSHLSETDRETVSTVTFTLKDQYRNGMDGEEITLTIDDEGLAEFWDPESKQYADSVKVLTDNDGKASYMVRAKAGVDHTQFRVEATYSDTDGSELKAYSKPIVVNSDLPHEERFSLAVDNFAPDTWYKEGVQVSITAYLADSEGNRIRDNTYVNFSLDGTHGSITPDCIVTDGQCTVTWESLKTDAPYSVITARTHGEKTDGTYGTIEANTVLLMSTNSNVHLELQRNGDPDPNGTEYCATAWVELDNQGTRFSPPVGTKISFEVETGEFAPGAADSETIASKGELVNNPGYEFCTTVRPEVDESVTPTAYAIEIMAMVETPDGGATDSDSTSDNWTD